MTAQMEWDGSWSSLEELEVAQVIELWERLDLYLAARKKNRDREFSRYLAKGQVDANWSRTS